MDDLDSHQMNQVYTCELGCHCYGLNYVPQKRYVEVLTPNTQEWDFTQKQVNTRGNKR